MSVYDWKLIEKEFIFKGKRNDTSYIYHDQLNRVNELINGFNQNNKDNEKVTSNIISVLGERGSGKSSFLETVSYSLKDDYLVIDKIDPTVINSEMSILELFVSEVYKEVNRIDITMQSDLDNKKLLLEIKNFVSILKSLRVSKSKFAEENSGIDVLIDIEKKTKIKHYLNNIITEFINFKNVNDKKSLKV